MAFSTDRRHIRWRTIAWGIGVRAMLAGTMANLISAAIAGIFLG